jgi:hypothetical protein
MWYNTTNLLPFWEKKELNESLYLVPFDPFLPNKVPNFNSHSICLISKILSFYIY